MGHAIRNCPPSAFLPMQDPREQGKKRHRHHEVDHDDEGKAKDNGSKPEDRSHDGVLWAVLKGQHNDASTETKQNDDGETGNLSIALHAGIPIWPPSIRPAAERH